MKKGSSLILVMLVISSVITVIVGAQRIALVQFQQAGQSDDNVQAYSAAKAGIEDGLLRFRYNKNAATSDGKSYRFDLKTGSSSGEVTNNTKVTTTNDQIYDLKMVYKTNKTSSISDSGVFTPDPNLTISDTSGVGVNNGFLELSGFGTTQYYLNAQFRFVNPGTNTDCNVVSSVPPFVEIQQVNKNITSQGSNSVNVQATINLATHRFDSSASGNFTINPTGFTTTSIRFRSYYCDVQYGFSATTSNNDTKPSTSGVGFNDVSTTITATGYYGQSQRTLLASVDRNTGRLISIYDFTAYAGGGTAGPGSGNINVAP